MIISSILAFLLGFVLGVISLIVYLVFFVESPQRRKTFAERLEEKMKEKRGVAEKPNPLTDHRDKIMS